MAKKFSGADMRCPKCNKYMPDRCICHGPSIDERRAAPPVGDDGLPPLSAPKGPFADYRAEEVEAYAKQVQREAYDAGRRAAVPAQTGTQQPTGNSVDTPEFADLLTAWGNALPGAPALNAAEALIAHINAWATRRAAVSTASAPDVGQVEELEARVQALLNHCPDSECYTCSRIICPHQHPLHFHHDGCPACAEHEAAPSSPVE